MRKYAMLLALLAALATGRQANGNFIVTVQNTTVEQGQVGLVDVLIRSDQAGGQALQVTNFEFRITVLSAGGPLQFTAPDSPDPTFSRSEYLFFGDSLDEAFGFSLGSPSLVVTPNDTYTGGDSTNSGSDVSLGLTNVLLVELPVSASLAAVGDTFRIDLINTGNTSFLDGTGSMADFSSNSGTVSVTENTPITSAPAPASAILAASGVASAFGFLALRGRRRGRPKAPGESER